MQRQLLKISLRSAWYNRKDLFYQIIIISILGAVICGSLLTGDSVRKSLARSLAEKTGNCDLLISSGQRYFDASLADRLNRETGAGTASVLELDGYCTNFPSGKSVLNTAILGLSPGFFNFHGKSVTEPDKGSVYINENLAKKLGSGPGDEIIINFTEVDPIPSNAPFAPKERNKGSLVLKISQVISGANGGNFSLATTQSLPDNIFVSIEDIDPDNSRNHIGNRLLIHNIHGLNDSLFLKTLKSALVPSDIGFKLKHSLKTGQYELVSDRIFIDKAIAGQISEVFPDALPVLTYLANSMSTGNRSTPYSFVSALPEPMLPVTSDDEIIISRWLADDLNAKTGDSLLLKWFDPGMGRKLTEKKEKFIIGEIKDMDFRYSDPSLMPDFPGISGRTTCSGWDAGVPILLDEIRARDEDYWTKYRGTPKAFISYNTGRKIWGNNFGIATAFRFPAVRDSVEIIKKLSGSINPSLAGFTLTNMKLKNNDAVSEGVDFGSLFLSLGFFIILSSVILLSISVTLFFDSRKKHVRTYHALGFNMKRVRFIISAESVFISVAGAFLGVIFGYFVNVLMINALNGVWTGAVQTRMLSPAFSLIPFLSGFLATVIISALLVRIKLARYLKMLYEGSVRTYHPHSSRKNLLYVLIFLLSALVFLVLSFSTGRNSILFSFTGGILLFAALILALRQYYIGRRNNKSLQRNYSGLYYSFNPSHAIAPAIFLAAGIFAVIITSANKKVISDKMLLPSGGTGGFMIWAETAIPVRYNLDTPEGRHESGFDEPELKNLSFVQAKRLSGDDASCLNISHVKSPPLLGIDPGRFISKGSFSFATVMKAEKGQNPWELLYENRKNNIIYGIADQTVLEWGLKLKTGDTLKYAGENGMTLNIVICAGMQSSVFQGYIIIGSENFDRFFPSVPGGSVFLADGERDKQNLYLETLSDRLSGSGIDARPAIDKLASFFEVTNTYLEVFMMLGALGLILGAAGLGFILRRNFNSRKPEFALMLAAGYTPRRIQILLLKDQFIILFWGLITGISSAFASTWPTINHGADMQAGMLIMIMAAMLLTGIMAMLISVRHVSTSALLPSLRKE